MGTHQACIGITNDEGFIAVVNAGTRTKHPSEGWVGVWEDASGARMTAHAARGTIDCSHPSFSGSVNVPARVTRSFADDECPYCQWIEVEVLDGDGNVLYRQLVLLEEMLPPNPALTPGLPIHLNPVGFVESLQVFRSADEYRRAQPPDARVGPRWLIHTGTFKSKDGSLRKKTSRVHVIGAVTAVRELVNTKTSVPFLQIVVESYAYPMELVVAQEQVAGAIHVGNVVAASCWVVARLMREAPAEATPVIRGGGIAFGDATREYFDGLPVP